jgi:DNA-binding CsgD family transcriptional regulator
MILRAKKIGFFACVSKEIQSTDFIQLLKYPSKEFASYPDIRQLNNASKAEEVISAFSLLTKREMEVVKILVMGKSSRDSADTLNISTYTLETHKKNIFRKLEINSIGELIHLAHEFKLVP